MKKLRFTQRACSTKSSGFKTPNSSLKEMYWSFVRQLKAERALSIHPSMIHSIDVTHTRRSPSKVTTFAKLGGGKQRAAGKTYLYTDSIVTCISADGVNHTPCLLFTFNPRMAPTQKNTVRGRGIRKAFQEALAPITEDRIYYVKSKKNYRGEDYVMYQTFLQRYMESGAIQSDHLILHDGGKAY